MSILASTLFFVLVGILFKSSISEQLLIEYRFMGYVIGILALDALVIIPFALLRAQEKPGRYAIIKILNVSLNLGFNVFFLLLLPKLAQSNSTSFFGSMYKPDFEISYILISNLIASGITLLLMLSVYL